MHRYAIFFMSHHRAFDFREVTQEDNANTVLIPCDTRFFMFVQSKRDPEKLQSIFNACEVSNLEAYIEQFQELTIEDNMLYFIGQKINETIINTWAEIETQFSEIQWNGTVRIMDTSILNLQVLGMPYRNGRKEFWGYHGDKVYIVALDNGGISSMSWRGDGSSRVINHLFQQIGGVMSDIEVVSSSHPEIYLEILERIKGLEKEHVYYKMLGDFCRKNTSAR